MSRLSTFELMSCTLQPVFLTLFSMGGGAVRRGIAVVFSLHYKKFEGYPNLKVLDFSHFFLADVEEIQKFSLTTSMRTFVFGR